MSNLSINSESMETLTHTAADMSSTMSVKVTELEVNAPFEINPIDGGVWPPIESIFRESMGTLSPTIRRPGVFAHVLPDTVPIQIWEGIVLQALNDERECVVQLTDKTGNLPAHTAVLQEEWISPQDLDLVVPGAVFYLSLYKETRNRTIRNWEEVRFRRLPGWSTQQLATVESEGADLFKRLCTNA